VNKGADGGHVRQALRAATMANHQRVDALFADFSLDAPDSYRAFLRAHARALGALEDVARPDSPRLPLLGQDLRALGESLPAPLPLADGGEGFRWGVRYALEGSRLGGAMLSRQVGEGLPKAYLCAVHEKGGWAAFQAEMDVAAAQGDQDWMAQAVAGAQAAFALFGEAGARERSGLHG